MLKYLRALPQIRPAALPEYVVVTGNQSADMDSCCSAILTAYLETVRGRPAVPLIQIPRREFALRRDIQFVLAQLGIDPAWIFFADGLETTDLTRLFMVDHNAPTLKGRPEAIIDHHEPEPGSAAALPQLDPSIVVKCGSCMSAVITHYTKVMPEITALFGADDVLVPLALFPILVDTSNLEEKVEDFDREAVRFLSQFNPRVHPFELLPLVRSEKNNIEGFTPLDMLRKDYKEWGTVGISSLPKLFEKLGIDSYALARAMLKYQADAHLEVIAALGKGKRKGQYRRQLAIAAPRDFDVAATCPDLQLVLTSDEDEVRFYNQQNITASRKQVAPQLNSAWAQYKAKSH